MDDLYKLSQELGIKPRTCLEVGAAHPTTCQLREFISNGMSCVLFEANPRLYYCLSEGWSKNEDFNFEKSWPKPTPPPYDNPGFKDLKNVKLYNIGIYDKEGEINVYERNASSFIEGVFSPAKSNDGYLEKPEHAFKIKCDTIDKYDDGTIDILAADCEGCEYYALKYLKSRPQLICLETHGQKYRNPFLKEIEYWMAINRYNCIARDNSDSLYVNLNNDKKV